MKNRIGFLISVLAVSLLWGMVSPALAQDKTEVYGFFDGYRNFDFKTGSADMGYPAIKAADMNGGGGGIAYHYASWFALWTQVSFMGTAETTEFSARLINNLQGLRYQTPQYGPFRFYGKLGLGFTNYSIGISGNSYGYTKFSLGYAGGAEVWMTDYLGLMVEAQHLIMGVPNLTDAAGRDRWDSGLSYKTGLAIRF